MTRAEFRKKAKTICKKAQNAYIATAPVIAAKISRTTGKSPRQVELQIISTYMVGYMHSKLNAVRRLPEPKGDEKQIEEILDAVEEVVEIAEKNPVKYRALQATFKHPYHAANELAKAYGISWCARA